MASAWQRTRVQERIEEVCRQQLGSTPLRRRVLDALSEAMDFSAYVWLLTDPVSTVGAAPLADVPCRSELAALIKWKYATPVNRWTTLLTRAPPVARLSHSVGGELVRSRVWREVMSRYGVRDVLSVVFADQYGCWGFLDLWRDADARPFEAADERFLGSVVGCLTSALRTGRARTFVEAATPRRHDMGPVVLTLDEDLTISGRTAASDDWLDVLLPPQPDERAVPASVYNVAAQLLAVEAGVDDHTPSTRAHLGDGLWLTLRAARLSRAEPRSPATVRGGEDIVVTIEEASALERLELFTRAFAFTTRESELLGLLATGSDTRTLARQMSLSEHTVQDHLKAIFTKTGARDRVSLLSRALGTRPHSAF